MTLLKAGTKMKCISEKKAEQIQKEMANAMVGIAEKHGLPEDSDLVALLVAPTSGKYKCQQIGKVTQLKSFISGKPPKIIDMNFYVANAVEEACAGMSEAAGAAAKLLSVVKDMQPDDVKKLQKLYDKHESSLKEDSDE